MEAGGASESYTRAGIRRILGINENRLRAWERVGLTEAKERYSFSDLISLKTLQGLREKQIPTKRIHEALQQLRRRLATVGHPLDELKVVTDGRRIAVELPGGKIEALTGQMLFQFDTESLRPVSTIETQLNAAAHGDRPEEGEALFQHALELETKGAPTPQVIDLYRQVLECNPQAAGALVNLGTLQFQLGQSEMAEEHYRQALLLYPEYALAHYNLGNVCDAAGRLEEAAEHYATALRHCPHYADAHYNLALTEERRLHWSAAAKHWQAYLQLDSTSPWARIARLKFRQLTEPAKVGELPVGGAFRKSVTNTQE